MLKHKNYLHHFNLKKFVYIITYAQNLYFIFFRFSVAASKASAVHQVLSAGRPASPQPYCGVTVESASGE